MSITELETTIHDLTVERDALKEQLENLKAGKPIGTDKAAEEAMTQLRTDLATANNAIADLHKEISDRDAVTANDKALIEDLQKQILALKPAAPPADQTVPTTKP